jgi:hypothetical protein
VRGEGRRVEGLCLPVLVRNVRHGGDEKNVCHFVEPVERVGEGHSRIPTIRKREEATDFQSSNLSASSLLSATSVSVATNSDMIIADFIALWIAPSSGPSKMNAVSYLPSVQYDPRSSTPVSGELKPACRWPLSFLWTASS